jgi:murein hydrolase activator
MIVRYGSVLALLLFFFADIGLAQQNYDQRRAEIVDRQNSTRSQIESLKEQIDTYSERLGFASERYDEMYQQFRELERVITLQQERIRQMNREQQQITEEISLIEENLANYEQRLKQLIDEYKQTLTFLYKNGRTTELALLLSSSSLNQLLVRSYYLGKFDEHRQEQVDQIEEAQKGLETAKSDLQETQLRNEEALAEIRNETQSLQNRKDLQNRNVELLRRDRDNLQEQVDIRQRQLDELSRALDNLIAEEASIRREEAAGTRAVRRDMNLSADELMAFESSFRDSRGQLPWPVDNGTITQRFGVRIHPVSGTRTNNPGIEITTPPRSTVRAVNDGYVFGIQEIRPYGETVLVSHGSYYTVYGNMSEIYVRRNQVISRGDVIGLSGDEDSLIGEALFFLIREGSENVNPEQWLQRAVP